MTRSGLILDDRYRLDERIAAGGVGQVWQARDLLLERTVAVKVLRPEYADHPETLERFRKEARNAGALNNPHVAQVYDYGHAGPDGSPYLVLEFVDGPSLADILVVDPIEPARALDIIAQAADGLSAAHRAGVIHRDIKPGNILISSEGKVKVTDFGIAHAAGQAPVTGPGLVMGTTQYMAPERIAGNHGIAASDLYALGIVLHECLTGMPPHDGTPAEVMAAHLYLPLPPLPPGMPPELDALVDRLTAKDPAIRMNDARELAELAARLRDAAAAGTLTAAAASPDPLGRALSAQAPAAPAPAAQAMSARALSAPGGAGSSSPGQAPRVALLDGGAAPGTARADDMHTIGLPAASDWTDPPRSARGDWSVPQRIPPSGGTPVLSPPGQPGQPGQSEQRRRQRRRTGILTIGAAVMASAGLVALLVSGAFRSTPTANQAPPRTTPTGRPTAARLPSPGPSGSTTAPSAAATSAATRPRSSTPASTPASTRATSPASPTASSGGSATSGGAPSTPAVGASGGTSGSTTSSSATASPSGSSTPVPSSSPTSSPPPSACLLGICL